MKISSSVVQAFRSKYSSHTHLSTLSTLLPYFSSVARLKRNDITSPSHTTLSEFASYPHPDELQYVGGFQSLYLAIAFVECH